MTTATARPHPGPQLSKSECALLFKSDKTGVLYLHPRDATIVKINPYLTDILDCDAGEVTGLPLASLGALPDTAANQEQVRRLLNDGYLRFDDLPLLTRAGVCARFSLRSVRTERDGTEVVECVLHDLSSPKQLADARVDEGDEFIARQAFHREFTLDAEREVERARRYGRPLSLLSIEIDRQAGDGEHRCNRIGDLSLRTFAEACAAVLRGSDSVGRVGESRFVAILPESSAADAATAAETLRIAVEYMEQPTKRGFSTRVTVSIGIATEGASYEELLISATQMLNVARDRGGNCIVSSRLLLH